MIRTDLACEAAVFTPAEKNSSHSLPGIARRSYELPGCIVGEVAVTSVRGAELVGKPRGRYLTVEPECLKAGFSDEGQAGAEGVAWCLRELLGEKLPRSVLVAGLGNREITPDAIGPWVVESVLVTRHLKGALGETFRPVAAVSPGVLGTTGVETGELIRGVVDKIRPDLVIAVDALAARSMERLCTTIQLADTGIVPGSGVGNARKALNEETLGVPVIAMGVPTVVDCATLAEELTGQEPEGDSPAGDLMVTPRNIDSQGRAAARVIAMGINLALQDVDYETVTGLVG